MIDINDIRKIGRRVREEISLHMEELGSDESLGKGASGDTTHPIDKRAEDIVIEELERLGEPVTLISEECGTREINGGGPGILLDPIDGSRNATTGIPLFSTSIALIEGDTIGETSIGYVINLISGDEYWATKDNGAFVNGLPAAAQKDGALRVISYESSTPRVDIPRIVPLVSLFQRVRCFGSTALDMAFLSRGALSVFVIPCMTRSFDIAGGYLLIREAGGIVTDLAGNDIGGIKIGVEKSNTLLASGNEELHRKALEVLNS